MFWLCLVLHVSVERCDTRAREVSPHDIALRQPNWPKRATQVANCFQNQFELPVLFYVLTILAIMTRHADFLFVVMAWIFVLTRLVHAYVHVTSNNLRMRGALVRRGRDRAVHHVGDLHRAHPARPAMTPAARLAAAIEVLADIEQHRRPAADALKDWGLTHRFAGSGDRAAIAGLVYDALRRRASSAWLMGEATPRAVLLGMLKRERGLDADAIAQLASGAGHSPPPLTDAERAALDRGFRRRRAAACRRRLSGMARSVFRARVRRRTRGGGRGARLPRAARSARQHAQGRPRRGGGRARRSCAGADALVAVRFAHPASRPTPRARRSMPSRRSSRGRSRCRTRARSLPRCSRAPGPASRCSTFAPAAAARRWRWRPRWRTRASSTPPTTTSAASRRSTTGWRAPARAMCRCARRSRSAPRSTISRAAWISC